MDKQKRSTRDKQKKSKLSIKNLRPRKLLLAGMPFFVAGALVATGINGTNTLRAGDMVATEQSKVVESLPMPSSLAELADRRTDTLSGGELARVHCARAFAAEAPLLVADEPTAALDPLHQFRIMDLIAAFVANGGGALVVLHDIQLAARYASRLIWMKDGLIRADGPPAETLTEARLTEIYGVQAKVDGRTITLNGAA